jgi:hypothetical protein
MKEMHMRAHDILEFVHREPFRPFRIQMSGRHFEIRHPEMVKVGTSALLIFSYVSDDPEIYDRYDAIGLNLIERIELIDKAATGKKK